MAVTLFTGFEAPDPALDGITLAGVTAPTYSTTQARTGTRSIRCAVGATTSSFFTIPSGSSFVNFALYVETSFSSSSINGAVVGQGNVGANLRFIPVAGSGTVNLRAFNGTTGLGAVMNITEGSWHWIGFRMSSGTSVPFLVVDGVSAAAATATFSGTVYQMGMYGVPNGEACTVYIDDVIIDSAGFLSSSKVIDLLPTADSAVGTGWTTGSGATTGLWDAVNNQPPTAVADTGTTAQIRNATSNASVNYDATLQTYTVGGIASGSTVLAVQDVISTAAPVTTSAKLGKVGNVSNPAITTVALGASGTAAAFWSGVAAGTWPTGWKGSLGTLTASPTVTLGTAPVMRVTQDTASTRIAMVGYMALRVAWTPGLTPVTGTGAGSGTASSSTGTAAETMSGTGAAAGRTSTASGSGTSLQSFSGTGAGSQAAQTSTGSGVEAISGTGAATQATQTASGSAIERYTGTGAGSQTTQTALGSAFETITGSGAGSQATATATGSGLLAITGSGSATQSAQTASGTGLETITPTGAGHQTTQTAAGTGSALLAVAGSGAAVQAAQTASGTGSHVAPMAGSGAGQQARQTATGAGLVSEVSVEITGTGSGTQARQTAHGSGLVAEIITELPVGGRPVLPYRWQQLVRGRGAGVQARQTAGGRGLVLVAGGGGDQPRQTASGTGRVDDDDLVIALAA
jgi:hypothetical protein